MDRPERQLLAYLADAHAVEEQALTQLRAAPEIAGEGELAAAFAAHLEETEGHERGVRQRLEAHGAEPSRFKDLAGRAGGWGMVLFARSQPDTPGKLVAHSFAYETMEYATYELLRIAAEAVGDRDTAELAVAIGGQESRMAERLAGLFDNAVEASLRELGAEQAGRHLDHYLGDAHALEQQALQMLTTGPKLIDDEGLAAAFAEHLEQTREHRELVAARLDARGAGRSRVKDVALRVGALNLGAFFGVQPDTTPKLAGFAYAFENLELGAYELLRRTAERAGDPETAAVAERIAAEEREAAAAAAACWERVMQRTMADAARA